MSNKNHYTAFLICLGITAVIVGFIGGILYLTTLILDKI